MVPVNRGKLTRTGAALVSFSGPLANLGLFLFSTAALLVMILLQRNAGMNFPDLLYAYFQVLGIYNLVLFFLNMLPIPGLDGWGILSEILPFKNVDSEFVKGAMLFFMLAVFVGIGYLFDASEWVLFWILSLVVG